MDRNYFEDFAKVVRVVGTNLSRIFSNFYENPRFHFLFNMAILPVIMLFAFDIFMSFLLSFRLKRLVLFNVISPKSWNLFKVGNIQNRLKVDSVSLKNHSSLRISRRMHNDSSLKYNRKQVVDGSLKFKGLSRIGMRFAFKLRKHDSKLAGNVFHKNYVNWKDSLPQLMSRQNMLLSELLRLLHDKKKK